MKKSVNQLQLLDLAYLANLDNYDILNNNELMWLLSSNIAEERIIAALLLRDRNLSSVVNVLDCQLN